MTGSIVQINISPGGVPKRPIAGSRRDAGRNPRRFLGASANSWRTEPGLLLITSEGIDELIAQGYPLYPGALGENLTTNGLDRRQMRIGQRYRAGEVMLEITKMRAPCATLDVYGPSIKHAVYDAQVKAAMLRRRAGAWADSMRACSERRHPPARYNSS